MTSLQGQLIGLFNDFGYKRIGIGCRLANEVCDMRGLHSGSDTFTIVEGAGLPRLTVIGHNRPGRLAHVRRTPERGRQRRSQPGGRMKETT
jgi:hypothetical protein